MVDVSDKDVTARTRDRRGLHRDDARDARALIETGSAKKGDVLATARIAGIMAAKKTHELIPLCHPLAITKATVNFHPVQNSRRHPRHGGSQSFRPNRRRDGSADRCQRGLPDNLRHAEGRRQRHDDIRTFA